MTIHIVHILGSADTSASSITRLVEGLALRLNPEQFKITACFVGGYGPWAIQLQRSAFEVKVINWQSRFQFIKAAELLRFLVARKFDIAHIHFGGRAVKKIVALAGIGRVIAHVHGYIDNEILFRPIVRDLRSVDQVIATSDVVARHVISESVDVVYPGINLQNKKVGNISNIVGAAGRLVPIKGFSHLINAFVMAREQAPNLQLEIAGDGPLLSDLRKQIHALGLTDSINLLGWQENMFTTMSRWGMYVQPSREEAFGIAAVEAMSMGLPVVASNVGGLAEVIKNEVTGLLVPPGDEAALSAAIIRLIHSPEEALRIGGAAYQASKLFGMDQFVSRIESIYSDLLNRP